MEAWTSNRIPQHSAAIAYYALFAMVPLLLLAMWLIGVTLGPQAIEGELHNQLEDFMGYQAATALEGLVRGVSLSQASIPAAIVAGVTLLFGVTGVFVELKQALDRIWGLRTRPGGGVWTFIYERLLSFAMVVITGLLLTASMVMTSVLALMRGWLAEHLWVPPEWWNIAGTSVAFVVETILFAIIFKVLPEIHSPWRDIWLGAVVTAVLFEAGKMGLGLYLERASTISALGAAGSLAVVLIWVYYSSMIVLTCAEFIEVGQRLRSVHREAETAHLPLA